MLESLSILCLFDFYSEISELVEVEGLNRFFRKSKIESSSWGFTLAKVVSILGDLEWNAFLRIYFPSLLAKPNGLNKN